MNKKFARTIRCSSARLLPSFAAFALAAGVVGVGIAGQTIVEVDKLTASDGAFDEFFGSTVSVSGDRAIVGAYGDDDRGTDSGSAYVFEVGPAGWVEQAKLTASDGLAFDGFGFSVSISGDRAVVGSWLDDDLGIDSGSAYVFERGPSGWVEQTKLTASDGAAFDRFGSSVSISGDRVIVGSTYRDEQTTDSGAAYVFEHGPSGWVEQAKLTASDGGADDRFGYSVSISGDRALVGAVGSNDLGNDSGSAYVFERGASGWAQQTKLTAADGAAFDRFGFTVSISDDRAVVGACYDDDLGTNSGSAYVFEHGPSGWVEQAKLTASDGLANDHFGCSVAISSDRAIVGARLNDALDVNSGSAYVFERGSSGWVQRTKLVAADGGFYHRFGWSVSLSNDRAIVGSTFDDELGLNSGSVYVFELDLAMATCTLRSGVLGLNPPDFTCTSEPKLGATWTSQIATTPLVGQTTSVTFMTVGLGGQVDGVQVFGYELLALPPFDPLLVSGTGSHALLLPSAPALAGAQFTAQGLRLETTGGTNIFVLTNALDLVLGL